MYPILLEWNGFILPSWHAFYVIAAIATYYFLLHLRKIIYPSINIFHLSNLYFICYFSGYFGARLFSIFNDQSNINTMSQVFLELFTLGPMTFYGGFLSAFICGSIYLILRKIPYRELYDIGILASLLGLAIGRIGCFLNGDDYGIPFTHTPIPWWIVSFPNHENPIPRHPVQLYETISVTLIVLALYLQKSNLQRHFKIGTIGSLAAASYAIARFLLEYLRGDERGWVISNAVSTSQFISIIVLIFSVSFLTINHFKSIKN